MVGGRGDAPLPHPPSDGGEFLLQLLRRPPQQPQAPPQQQPPPPSQNLPHDPAVAAVGPSIPLPPFSSNGHDLPYRSPWPNSSPPPSFAPHNFFVQGFPQNPNPNPSPNLSSLPQPTTGFNHTHQNNLQFNHNLFGEDNRKLGFLGTNLKPNSAHPQEHNLMFGSLPCEIPNKERVSNGNSNNNLATRAKVEALSSKEREMGLGKRRLNGLEDEFPNSLTFNRNLQVNSHEFQNHEKEWGGSGGMGLGPQQHGSNYKSPVAVPQERRPPPGFPSKPRSGGNRIGSFKQNLDKGKSSFGQLNHRGTASNDKGERERIMYHDRSVHSAERGLRGQFDYPGPSAGSNLHSVSASDIEESLLGLQVEDREDGKKSGNWMLDQMRKGGGRGQSESDDLDEQPTGTLVPEDGLDEKNNRKQHKNSRDKDYRSDKRGKWLLGQKMRNIKRQVELRSDINRLNAPFLAIYESLIPAEEEKAKQKQLLTLLEKHVIKEWPEARLYLYGSCANSFGFRKSDIDVCLAIEDADVNKSEVLLKLADILQSDNLQNVQALTRARVPIVKLMDPATGISCDICVNNLLAVVNTKLLRDYAQIDVRLRQLAFIVKHWAKSRGVNETYQGTLSSYAYVLMCIHFLQHCRPAILPCLQVMERTYVVNVDNIECAYFDQVEKLSAFGSRNGESIAQLVWAFFNYWAYCHDYANDVISVRTGSILSKRLKDWTRRIGNDRHLICIEDPFEVSHDLGRVVDKYSIRVLREEFERAAEIMQYDPDPCAMLFKPYVPS